MQPRIIRPDEAPAPAPMLDRQLGAIISREERVRKEGTPTRLFQQFITPDSHDAERAAHDELVARKTFDILDQLYPGHLWNVIASTKNGIVRISIPTLMGGNWAYVIKWQDMSPHKVILAGGELLERYGLPRGRFELGSFLTARQNHGIPNLASKVVPS